MAAPITYGQPGYAASMQPLPGANRPVGNARDVLMSVLHAIVTPNKNSQVAGILGSLAKTAVGKGGPMNLAMMIGGGDSPLGDASWLENYNFPKAMTSGHVTFREGQPYDVHSAISSAKTNELLSQYGGRTPDQKQLAIQHTLEARQMLHDALFGGTVHMAPGHSIPPRP